MAETHTSGGVAFVDDVSQRFDTSSGCASRTIAWSSKSS
jgi:hypothetical protein